jgi:hypothetical protein
MAQGSEHSKLAVNTRSEHTKFSFCRIFHWICRCLQNAQCLMHNSERMHELPDTQSTIQTGLLYGVERIVMNKRLRFGSPYDPEIGHLSSLSLSVLFPLVVGNFIVDLIGNLWVHGGDFVHRGGESRAGLLEERNKLVELTNAVLRVLHLVLQLRKLL